MIKEKKDKACSVSGVTQQRTTKKMEQENAQGDAQKPHQSRPSMRRTERASICLAMQLLNWEVFLYVKTYQDFFLYCSTAPAIKLKLSVCRLVFCTAKLITNLFYLDTRLAPF